MANKERFFYVMTQTFSIRLSTNTTVTLATPAVMGVINMSPNSFYQPLQSVELALREAEAMVAAGVDMIDIGGEATNPFVDITAEKPQIQQEIERVAPVISAIKKHFDVLVSVDTSQPAVMQAAVEQGADIINDQRALQVDGALAMASTLKVPVILMHFFMTPRQPDSTSPQTLFAQIASDLKQTIQRCVQAGIEHERIIIDPGFGGGKNYGKSTDENYYLLSRLAELTQLGYPILAGWSRKSMLGDTLNGAPPTERLYASIASATIAALQGASILRVHDVKPTIDAIKTVQYFQKF